MKVDIAIYLFTEAEIEMQDAEICGQGIREYATEKADFLRHAADLADILRRDGWSLKVVHTNLVGTHPEVKSAEQATARLLALEASMT